MPDPASSARIELPEEIDRAIEAFEGEVLDRAEGVTSMEQTARSVLTAAILSRLRKAEARREEADLANDALNAKLRALAPHGSCGCSYDRPDDVCMHHSPALSAALARVERLEKRVNAALDDACRMSAILLMAGEMTAQERRTAQAVANGLAAKVRAALAPTQAEGER